MLFSVDDDFDQAEFALKMGGVPCQQEIERRLDLRYKLLDNGYEPVPTFGKAPKMS
jgi:hypothetical protein